MINNVDKAVHKHAGLYMQNDKANGMSIGVYFDGKKYTYNYGEIEKGSGKLPSSDTFYGLGSIDKIFVANLLARAVVEERVNLDDDIRKYLPGKFENLVYDKQPVRLINLANHTSGLPRTFRSFATNIQDSLRQLTFKEQVNFYAQYSRDSLLADLQHVNLDTIPGATYRYNNNDIKILIALLEEIYKQSYDQLLTSYLSKNLSMSDTKTELSANEMKRASVGYFRENEPQEFLNFKGFIAGPTVVSTINDMLKYLDANLNVKDKAIKLTHNQTWGNEKGFGIGLGWMMDIESNGKRYIYHDGNTRLGFNSLCIFYPESYLGFIIIVNDNISLKRIGEMANRIRNELL